MARSQSQLQSILEQVVSEEPEDKIPAYFQPKMNDALTYPCIVYERNDSFVSYADNIKYVFFKRYNVTVIAREPDSLIPDLVEQLPLTSLDRKFTRDGLNHTVFNLYF